MITERHVLTAAHCAINDDLVSVRLGEHQIGNDTDGANPIGMFNWLTLDLGLSLDLRSADKKVKSEDDDT